MSDTSHGTGYHIQPYHINGLNWRVVPDGTDKGNITVVTGFMTSLSYEYLMARWPIVTYPTRRRA